MIEIDGVGGVPMRAMALAVLVGCGDGGPLDLPTVHAEISAELAIQLCTCGLDTYEKGPLYATNTGDVPLFVTFVPPDGPDPEGIEFGAGFLDDSAMAPGEERRLFADVTMPNVPPDPGTIDRSMDVEIRIAADDSEPIAVESLEFRIKVTK